MVTHLNFRQFDPFFVGFDRMWDTIERIQEAHGTGKPGGFPPYNIIKIDEDNYTIEMAVAGFSEEDLEVTLKEDELTVVGKESTTDERARIHSGLAKRDFKRGFTLGSQIEVREVSLNNGMLVIKLERVIPDELKPRQLKINGPIENPTLLNG